MIKAWFYLMLGLVLFFAGVYLTAGKISFRFTHPKTTGVVTGLISDPNGKAESCFPQVVFTASSGQAMTFVGRESWGRSFLPKVGNNVDVYYDPNDLNKTQIDLFSAWMIPIGLVWGGLACLMGAFLFLKEAKKKRETLKKSVSA